MTARTAPGLSTLGAVLRCMRRDLGLSQEQLAARCDVHRTYIGGVERGERNPSYATLERLIHGLESDWADFGRAIERARLGARTDSPQP